MKTYTYISKSEQETMQFAYTLASHLKKGDIIILNGELGAGKTKFTEGFLSYFGLAEEISSPTFTIVNEYKGQNINIYHFDVYRLENSDEFYAIGGEEYFQNGICIIEWGNIIQDVLPQNYIEINIQKDYTNDNLRNFEIITYGKKFDNIIEKIL